MEDVDRGSRNPIVIRASAEFVVIVIGVLVAFAVDDWAAAREDRADEIQLLQQLAEELSRDSTILANALIPPTVGAQAALQRVDAVASGASQFPSDTMDLLLDVLSGRGPRVNRLGTRATFDELLSTGSLRLIESSTLRAAVVSYYGDKDLAERQIEFMRSEYPDLLSLYLPFPSAGPFVDVPPDNGTREALLRAHGLVRASEVFTDADFSALITAQANFLRDLHPILASSLRANEGLAAAVQVELANLR